MNYQIPKEETVGLVLPGRRNMDLNDKMLYTVKEASATLGVNVHVVYSLIKKGLLPAMKLGSLKIRKTSLEDFISTYDGKDLSDLDNIVTLNID